MSTTENGSKRSRDDGEGDNNNPNDGTKQPRLDGPKVNSSITFTNEQIYFLVGKLIKNSMGLSDFEATLRGMFGFCIDQILTMKDNFLSLSINYLNLQAITFFFHNGARFTEKQVEALFNKMMPRGSGDYVMEYIDRMSFDMFKSIKNELFVHIAGMLGNEPLFYQFLEKHSPDINYKNAKCLSSACRSCNDDYICAMLSKMPFVLTPEVRENPPYMQMLDGPFSEMISCEFRKGNNVFKAFADVGFDLNSSNGILLKTAITKKLDIACIRYILHAGSVDVTINDFEAIKLLAEQIKSYEISGSLLKGDFTELYKIMCFACITHTNYLYDNTVLLQSLFELIGDNFEGHVLEKRQEYLTLAVSSINPYAVNYLIARGAYFDSDAFEIIETLAEEVSGLNGDNEKQHLYIYNLWKILDFFAKIDQIFFGKIVQKVAKIMLEFGKSNASNLFNNFFNITMN